MEAVSLRDSVALNLEQRGCEFLRSQLPATLLAQIRETIFVDGRVGQRCLLDEPVVRDAATRIRAELLAAKILPLSAVTVQAIAFDKTAVANWKVTWHQDLMFPFRRPVVDTAYALPSRKDGVDYARPPLSVLQDMLAVRLHLDDCDETNGPLRVSPRTHTNGVILSTNIAATIARHGEIRCLAKTGELVLMRPLTLHASSPAREPKHRRVLHLVYHSGAEIAEPWHRTV